jgi:heme/copper-type cytochrome/quinol oxidase subunit 3
MPDKVKVGMAIFIISEVGFFGTLLTAYVYFQTLRQSGPTAAASLEFAPTLAFSICLFLSSATIHMAARSFTRKNWRNAGAWLAVTLALGAAFLFGQMREYLGLSGRGVTFSTNLFGSTFYTLTGFHGLHVLMGLIALGTLFTLASQGRLGEVKPAGFEAVSMYWHFVDAVWVVIFSAVYVWPHLS